VSVLHLVHPVLVHFTIAFLVVGGLVEAYGIAAARERPERFGGALTLLGTIALVPTIVAGFLAENSLPLNGAAASTVDDHERLGLIVLGIFAPLLVVKAWGRGRPPERWRGLYAAGLIAGVAAAGATAYVGGLMVYRLGVGVAAP
jgi:uncharacterized membrane protein